VVKRRKEFEGRQPAMDELGSTIIRYEKKVALHKEGVSVITTAVVV